MARLRLFVDLMSQPSRATLLFCRASRTPVEVRLVNIAKGGTRDPEYRALYNPLGKVPCLVDDGTSIPESCTILRHLAGRMGREGEAWYPSDPLERARVDSALDWHHTTLRRGAAGLVFAKYIAPRLGQQQHNAAAEAEAATKVLRPALRQMETYWLGNSHFVAGQGMTIADLVLMCEVHQLRVLVKELDGVDMAQLLQPCPRVRQWLEACEAALEPHLPEACKVLDLVERKRRKQAAGQPSKL
mmetsp:Transcript_18101/g.51065  ORF Transcript_18101/g.51065 Transcript_18101/m.51065 type:complete len:244 (-) Transcript_18101:109-840(-)